MRVLVTGGATGIGEALTYSLCALNEVKEVIVIGRRADLLSSLAQSYPNKIFPIQADVSDEDDRSIIINKVKNDHGPLTHIVHNAAIIEPVSPLREITLNEYRKQHAINTEAPLFLTQGLLPHASTGCRVLFISSEAAINPWRGIGSYSISKAALEMVCKAFIVESTDNSILFATLHPGGVHTPMAEKLSKFSLTLLPDAAAVARRIKEGDLLQPETSASFIAWVLIHTSDLDYQKCWDINNEKDKALWKAWLNTKQVEATTPRVVSP